MPEATLETTFGRRYAVTSETDVTYGRVIYHVAGVGAFTLERHPYGYPGRRSDMQCIYGVLHDADRWTWTGALPNAPEMFGITIGGAAVYDPERFAVAGDDGGRWPLPMMRATEDEVRGSVPERTAFRITEIVGLLTRLYLERADRHALEHAQDVHRAPSRLAGHQRTIDQLIQEISERQTALEYEQMLAAVQYELLHPRSAQSSVSEGHANVATHAVSRTADQLEGA